MAAAIREVVRVCPMSKSNSGRDNKRTAANGVVPKATYVFHLVKVEIRYAYPSSSVATAKNSGGFYVTYDGQVASPMFGDVNQAEEFCQKNNLQFQPHGF